MMATLAKMARNAAEREARSNEVWQSMWANLGTEAIYVGISPRRAMPRPKLAALAVRAACAARAGKEPT